MIRIRASASKPQIPHRGAGHEASKYYGIGDMLQESVTTVYPAGPPCTAEGGLRAVEDAPDDIKRGDDPKYFRRDFSLSAEDRVRKLGASFIQGARSEAWDESVTRIHDLTPRGSTPKLSAGLRFVVIAYSSQPRGRASK